LAYATFKHKGGDGAPRDHRLVLGAKEQKSSNSDKKAPETKSQGAKPGRNNASPQNLTLSASSGDTPETGNSLSVGRGPVGQGGNG